MAAIFAVSLIPAWTQNRGLTLVEHEPAEGRQLALVIGNDKYSSFPELQNAKNDAKAMFERLSNLGYDAYPFYDVSQATMRTALTCFFDKVKPGDIALFYYAGHARQSQSENYLIPVDHVGDGDVLLRSQSVGVNKVAEDMSKRGARLKILILDACREVASPSRQKGIGNGLAEIPSSDGMLIAFAAEPGKPASDGRDQEKHGLFTKHLLDVLSKPGLNATAVFDEVAYEVSKASDKKQIPTFHSTGSGRYVFNRGMPISDLDDAPPIRVSTNPKDGQQYIRIPAGSFIMGCSEGDLHCEPDESPSHKVVITKPFWMGQKLVTLKAWRQYEQLAGSKTQIQRVPNTGPPDDQRPVVGKTWDEAKAFCIHAGGRLPSEAEWEYAARRGPGMSGRLDEMLGHIWQWTNDPYDDKYYRLLADHDPVGPETDGDKKVLRGGAWSQNSKLVRISARRGRDRNRPEETNGFRCVWTTSTGPR